MTHPKISIITPSFNRSGMIPEAVESVLAQDYPEFEHIIIDAASTDGTMDVLSRYPHLRVLSEPDRGMYDAINKGIKLARGEILAWLNTDDVYPPEAFKIVVSTFDLNPAAFAVSGGADTFIAIDGKIKIVNSELAIDNHDFWKRIVESPVPNGWFFKKALFEKIGYFNSEFRLVADREFIIRVALAGIRPIPIAKTLYRYRMHPGSATFHAEDSRDPVLGPRRMEINCEDLRMLSGFLHRADLPMEVRQVMIHANDEYAYRLASTAIYHHRWELARKGIQAGFSHDPLFPVMFIRFALRRLIKRRRHG